MGVFASRDRVVGALGALAEAVEDDENERARATGVSTGIARNHSASGAVRPRSAVYTAPRHRVASAQQCPGQSRSSADRRCSRAASADGDPRGGGRPRRDPLPRTTDPKPTAPRVVNLELLAGEPLLARRRRRPGSGARAEGGEGRGPERLDKSPGAQPTSDRDGWIAFTDGACSGNPGPAGSGIVLIRPGGKHARGLRVPRRRPRTTSPSSRRSCARSRAFPLTPEHPDPHRQPVLDRRAHQGWKAKANQELIAKTRASLAQRPQRAARLRARARRGAAERARGRAGARGDPSGTDETRRDRVALLDARSGFEMSIRARVFYASHVR